MKQDHRFCIDVVQYGRITKLSHVFQEVFLCKMIQQYKMHVNSLAKKETYNMVSLANMNLTNLNVSALIIFLTINFL